MIAEVRQAYNRQFSQQRYEAMLASINSAFAQPLSFRLSETPLFADQPLKTKLLTACDEIIDFIARDDFNQLTARSIPQALHVPGESAHPMFLALDFALVRQADGNIHPRLIEMQGFPSLFGFQHFVSQQYKTHMYCPEGWSSYFDITYDTYTDVLKRNIVGGHNPENVVLLEYDPMSQNTAIDFFATEKYTGVKILDIADVKKEGRELYYEHDGKRIPIHRIYNRIIFDELSRHQDLNLNFNLTEDVQVEWAGHPNWFFRVSKYTMPLLKSTFIPSCHFLHELKQMPENLANYVLKPLFSFSGQGVIFNVTQTDIDAIPAEEKQNYILQEKVQYEPIVQAPDGMVKAELRMLYIWEDGAPRPTPVTNLVRMSRGEMVGVRYNKDKTWVGGSVCFFEP